MFLDANLSSTFLIHKEQNATALVNSFLYPRITSGRMGSGGGLKPLKPDRPSPLSCHTTGRFRTNPPIPKGASTWHGAELWTAIIRSQIKWSQHQALIDKKRPYVAL
jgi:hypothetical protein